MKKRFLSLLLATGLVLAATGCRYDYTYDLSNASGAKVSKKVYYTEDELKQLGSDKSKYDQVTLEDGNIYYMEAEEQTETYQSLNDGLDIGIMKSNLVYIPCSKINSATESESPSVPDLYNAMKINMTFKLSEEVTETNGEICEDKHSVYYDYKGKTEEGYLYIYTANGKSELENDKTAPVIGGLKKNKYINAQGLRRLRVTDNLALKSVTCNGYDMSSSLYTDYETKMRVRYWTLKDSKQYKQGKNTVVATDLNGNSTTYTFRYDGEPPVFKKIKNYQTKRVGKKITFYVKDKGSGISKVTYSKDYNKEKKVAKKYMKKVKKGKYKGYYKVSMKFNKPCYLRYNIYDKAGNSTQIYGINVVNY